MEYDKVSDFFNRIYVKLIQGTHHDAINIASLTFTNPHKILGFCALFHFLYRYFLSVTTGSMHFYENTWDLQYIFFHLLLSFSSFLFPVRKARNLTNQIIWRELQLHNIVFTSRSCAIFTYHLYFPCQNIWSRFLIVMAFHLAADCVTFYYKAGTTIRDASCDNELVASSIKPYLDKFYAFSQFSAIVSLIVPTEQTLERAFMIMFSIQLSTFLMTLRLKGIINNDGWHIFYLLSLLMNFHTAVLCCKSDKQYYTLFVSMVFYVWRVQLQKNKYVGWFVVIFIYDLIMNQRINLYKN